MSTSAASPVAPAAASPPRGTTRPPHPRPTTYCGASPSVPASSSASASASGSVGPPIPPPPRTSSKTQAPPANSASSSSDTRVNSRGGNGNGNGNGASTGNSAAGNAGDGQQDRSERDRDRRKPDAGSTRQDQPVGRSNSTRAAGSSSRTGASAGHHHHYHHQQTSAATATATDGRTGSRRRHDSESGGAGRSRAAATDSGHHHHAAANNGAGGGGGEPSSSARRTTTRKETRFGEYILGQTLGEGEFGKVKLGWRRDGGVQVAIKLIRRDSVSPHPNRLSKIYREIAILRTLSHPNIVRLHEMVETDRHIGIILEYASGGELFDYILTHRYLKDPPACRLFAQLVSGVGYLHKKGIVHRDLKLENLLLDRNRNIIITDFGFANVFDPTDELGELEDRLEDPAVSKELEKGVTHTDRQPDGSSLLSIIGPGQTRRRGDLMATSCGSPCYAAPELVVSDGLYTGRKVDVWSCGVILYAMLAGYLPFDDDPANPEGDNINLLYKYIVSTPLTFPEYVTPHARDLLRRILVPDPRRRADLFEVARHSWLSPFADIVNKVTSATTGIKDVETATVTEPKQEAPVLNRSHSVREPSSTSHHHSPGALGPRHHAHEQIVPATQSKPSSDNKRRTVQVEYVEPQSQTKRGSAVDPDNTSTAADRRRGDVDDAAPPPVVATHKDGSLTRAATNAGTSRAYNGKYMDKQKARDVPKDSDPKLPGPEKGKTRPVSYQYQQSAPASRAGASTDGPTSGPPSRRPSRDRGGPPVSGKQLASTPADTGTRPNTANSLGSNRLPSRSGAGAGASAGTGGSGGSYSRPAAPSVAASNAQGRIAMPKASSSSGKVYQISNPMPATEAEFNAGARPATQPDQQPAKGHKRANTVSGGGIGSDSGGFLGKIMGTSGGTADPSPRPPVVGGTGSSSNPRQSLDQGRSKPDRSSSSAPKGRRFSLLPASFSLRAISGGGEGRHERKLSRSGSRQYGQSSQPQNPQVQSQPQLGVRVNDGVGAQSGSETSLAAGSAPPSAMGEVVLAPPPTKKTTLSKHKKFGDAYEGELSSGGHGSSGPARRVMDFFRRRGAARSKGEKS